MIYTPFQSWFILVPKHITSLAVAIFQPAAPHVGWGNFPALTDKLDSLIHFHCTCKMKDIPACNNCSKTWDLVSTNFQQLMHHDSSSSRSTFWLKWSILDALLMLHSFSLIANNRDYNCDLIQPVCTNFSPTTHTNLSLNLRGITTYVTLFFYVQCVYAPKS